MSGKRDAPKILTWNNTKVYRCRLCAFDTFNKATFEDHFRRVHPPFEVIDGTAPAAAPVTHEMTRDQLREHAEAIGVTDLPASATKADIIAAIEAATKDED